MPYLVVRKQTQIVCYAIEIVLPYSHVMESKSEAMAWMLARNLQHECKVQSSQLPLILFPDTIIDPDPHDPTRGLQMVA